MFAPAASSSSSNRNTFDSGLFTPNLPVHAFLLVLLSLPPHIESTSSPSEPFGAKMNRFEMEEGGKSEWNNDSTQQARIAVAVAQRGGCEESMGFML